MSGFIAVYLIVCLNAANHETCTKLPITDNTQAQADGVELTISGCQGIQGAISAQKYWEEHSDLHKKFQFGGWACQVGNKKAPDRGGA
jgi:hypothetical protein